MDKAQSSVNSFQIPFHVSKWPMAVVLSQQTVQTMFELLKVEVGAQLRASVRIKRSARGGSGSISRYLFLMFV